MSTTLASQPSDLEQLETKIRQGAGWPTQNLIIQTIVDISNEIPSNVNTLNSSLADYLAGRFLQGMLLTGDLVSIALQYEMKTDSLKKQAYARAMLERAPAAGYKRQKDAEQYAYIDPDYHQACSAFNEAKAFRIMLGQKHQAFEKAHHHMRKVAEQRMDNMGQNSKEDSQGRDSLMLDNDWGQALRE